MIRKETSSEDKFGWVAGGVIRLKYKAIYKKLKNISGIKLEENLTLFARKREM